MQLKHSSKSINFSPIKSWHNKNANFFLKIVYVYYVYVFCDSITEKICLKFLYVYFAITDSVNFIKIISKFATERLKSIKGSRIKSYFFSGPATKALTPPPPPQA